MNELIEGGARVDGAGGICSVDWSNSEGIEYKNARCRCCMWAWAVTGHGMCNCRAWVKGGMQSRRIEEQKEKNEREKEWGI